MQMVAGTYEQNVDVDGDTAMVDTHTGAYRVKRVPADWRAGWDVTVEHVGSVYPVGPPTVTTDIAGAVRSWRSGTGPLSPSHTVALGLALSAWQEAEVTA